MMRILLLAMLALTLMLSPLGADRARAQESGADIVDTAIEAGSFETLVTAVDAAGLVETLKGEGPFTVFAPTDDAFAALPDGTIDALLADPEGALTDILLYHVVPGKVMAADVAGLDGAEVATVGGDTIVVSVDGESIMINDTNVVQADIETSNGVIHVIDAVLVPPTASNADAAEDADAAGADETAEGADADATETEAVDEADDDEAVEGDAADTTDEQAAEEPAEMAADTGAGDDALADIVDTAVGAGSFDTLVAAVQAAGLEETLRGDGPFTVFAPTDDAFATLPAELLDTLLADPSGALTDILLYHVVAGEVLAADVVGLDGAEVETVGGESFVVTIEGETVRVDDATVIATDVVAANGVIHVIDSVLVPPSVREALSDVPAPAQDGADEPAAMGRMAEPKSKYPNVATPSDKKGGMEDGGKNYYPKKWHPKRGYHHHGGYCR